MTRYLYAILCLIAGLLVLSGCKRTAQSVEGNFSPIVIDISKSETRNPSEDLSIVGIVPLETGPDLLVGDIRKIQVTDDAIVILDSRQEVFLFNGEGKLISKLGRKGRGQVST